MAAAMGMPPDELEVLRVASLERVADVREVDSVERVVVAQLDLDADHEVHLLPSEVVARPVRDVGLRGREPPGVLVAAPVDSASGMEGLRRLREP